MQKCKNAELQICKYANMQIRKYANTQICKYANMQICKYAKMKKSTNAQSHKCTPSDASLTTCRTSWQWHMPGTQHKNQRAPNACTTIYGGDSNRRKPKICKNAKTTIGDESYIQQILGIMVDGNFHGFSLRIVFNEHQTNSTFRKRDFAL